MIVYPAIDILDGKVVRLRQGRLDAVTVYHDSPVEQAEKWESLGAEWIHVVDLDGAVTGQPQNIEYIRQIAEKTGVHIQTGGGVRNMDTLRRLVDAGVERVVLGTTIVTQPEFVSEATGAFGDTIVAGVDARDGKVAIEGWYRGTEFSVFQIVKELEILGVTRLAYTDIALDGTQRGINYGAYRVLVDQLTMSVIASGGVSSLQDVRDLAAIGRTLDGVIVGTALYEDQFTLPEAIEAAK